MRLLVVCALLVVFIHPSQCLSIKSLRASLTKHSSSKPFTFICGPGYWDAHTGLGLFCSECGYGFFCQGGYRRVQVQEEWAMTTTITTASVGLQLLLLLPLMWLACMPPEPDSSFLSVTRTNWLYNTQLCRQLLHRCYCSTEAAVV